VLRLWIHDYILVMNTVKVVSDCIFRYSSTSLYLSSWRTRTRLWCKLNSKGNKSSGKNFDALFLWNASGRKCTLTLKQFSDASVCSVSTVRATVSGLFVKFARYNPRVLHRHHICHCRLLTRFAFRFRYSPKRLYLRPHNLCSSFLGVRPNFTPIQNNR
jgi:hypothetical protein